MSFTRSKPRGSGYRQKQIDPINVHIAFEGAVDEAQYFAALKRAIPKQFSQLVELIVVDKSSTASAPNKVYDDLVTHLSNRGIKLKPHNRNGSDHIAYMVIDKDHFFKDGHVKNTRQTLKNAKLENIEVICSAPSFDLWLLCHYLDIATLDEQIQKALYENKTTTATH